jgi:hypothetical protein
VTTQASTRHLPEAGRTFWVAGFALAMIGCVGPAAHSSSNERPLETSRDHHGIQFDTTTSRPIPFTLPAGSTLGLLHEDQHETERPVRVALEQAIFSLKATIPSLVIVERRSTADLQKEFAFQSSGFVRDHDLAKIGHFLGLDYVAVFDPLYQDLNKLYGLRNQIDTWEVALPLKIIAVNTAEVKLHCLATVKTKVGKQMTATEVRALNQDALGIAASLAGQCLSASLTGTSSR